MKTYNLRITINSNIIRLTNIEILQEKIDEENLQEILREFSLKN